MHASSALGVLKMNKRNKENNETRLLQAASRREHRTEKDDLLGVKYRMITLCELLSEVCQSIMRTLILAKITTLLVSFYTHLVVKAIFHTSEKRMKIYVPHKICMRYRHTSEKNDIRLLFMCIRSYTH